MGLQHSFSEVKAPETWSFRLFWWAASQPGRAGAPWRQSWPIFFFGLPAWYVWPLNACLTWLAGCLARVFLLLSRLSSFALRFFTPFPVSHPFPSYTSSSSSLPSPTRLFDPIRFLVLTMASVTRLSNSALKASLRAPAFGARSAAFTSVRCYSAKTQVRLLRHNADRRPLPNSAPRIFADMIPTRRLSRSASPSCFPRRLTRSRPFAR